MIAPSFTFSPAVREALAKTTDAFRTFADLSAATQALAALSNSGKPVYAGTVPFAEVQRHRAANKVARASRRINRAA